MKTLKTLKTFTKAMFRWKKPVNPINDFFRMNNAIEEMEREGKLLLVYSNNKPGIVLNHKLAQYFQLCYVTRMEYYAKRYGLENFFKARHAIRKFSLKNNPDEELLALCRNARMVITYRQAASGAENFDISDEPLYITYMDEALDKPTHIGYEIHGEITIEPMAEV